MVANPNYYKGEPGRSTRSCSASSPTATPWWRHCNRARSTPRTHAVVELRVASATPRASSPSSVSRAASPNSAMNGMAGGHRRRPPGAAGHRRASRDRPRDRQAGAVRPCDPRPRHAGVTLSVSPDPAWKPEIPEPSSTPTTAAAANRLLDDAGYVDTDGNGVREMPDGSQELVFRYAERSESDTSAPVRELISGLAGGDRASRPTVEVYDDTQLTEVIASGRVRPVRLGLDPVRRPRPDAVVLHVRPAHHRRRAVGYNDANWCSPEYDELYAAAELRARSGQRGSSIVHQMLRAVLRRGDLRGAVRGRRPAGVPDRSLRGLVRQPAEHRARSSSPTPRRPTSTCASSAPAARIRTHRSLGDGWEGSSGDDGGSSTGLIIGGLAAVVVLGGGALLVLRSRRRSEGRRE